MGTRPRGWCLLVKFCDCRGLGPHIYVDFLNRLGLRQDLFFWDACKAKPNKNKCWRKVHHHFRLKKSLGQKTRPNVRQLMSLPEINFRASSLPDAKGCESSRQHFSPLFTQRVLLSGPPTSLWTTIEQCNVYEHMRTTRVPCRHVFCRAQCQQQPPLLPHWTHLR